MEYLIFFNVFLGIFFLYMSDYEVNSIASTDCFHNCSLEHPHSQSESCV